MMVMIISIVYNDDDNSDHLTKEPSHDNEEEDFTIMTIVICISVTKHLRKSLVVSHF